MLYINNVIEIVKNNLKNSNNSGKKTIIHIKNRKYIQL